MSIPVGDTLLLRCLSAACPIQPLDGPKSVPGKPGLPHARCRNVRTYTHTLLRWQSPHHDGPIVLEGWGGLQQAKIDSTYLRLHYCICTTNAPGLAFVSSPSMLPFRSKRAPWRQGRHEARQWSIASHDEQKICPAITPSRSLIDINSSGALVPVSRDTSALTHRRYSMHGKCGFINGGAASCHSCYSIWLDSRSGTNECTT